MRLLLAVDSISTTEMIVRAVESRLWPAGTKARILSVVEDGEVSQEIWREEGYQVGAVHREMKRRGEQISALAMNRLRRAGIRTRVVVTRGNPAFLISYAAREWSADLILIRAHNRSDFRNRILGSVAKSVVKAASCSIELVRATRDDSISGDGLRLLLAVDNSEGSIAAAEHIAQTSWPENTKVNVISVVNPLIYSLEEIGLYTGIERAHQAINDAVQVMKTGGLEISAAVVAGLTKGKILKQAKLFGADLIILGSNKRQGLKRLILPATSEAVANRAHCSVRIIRAQSRLPTAQGVNWPFFGRLPDGALVRPLVRKYYESAVGKSYSKELKKGVGLKKTA
jgi:nucleotide-binding universal stress UspA family protein